MIVSRDNYCNYFACNVKDIKKKGEVVGNGCYFLQIVHCLTHMAKEQSHLWGIIVSSKIIKENKCFWKYKRVGPKLGKPLATCESQAVCVSLI